MAAFERGLTSRPPQGGHELRPVYPASSEAPLDMVREAIALALTSIEDAGIFDPIPAPVRQSRDLPGLPEALMAIHRPQTREEYNGARRRFKFEEAFLLQAAMARRRAEIAAQAATARPGRPDGLLEAFDAALPFTLTEGQQQVAADLSADLAGRHPMQRLLQGEVGSGKTVVALRAMLQVVDSGGQAALLAPTEVLAAQHARSLRTMLGPLAEGGMLGGAAHGTQIALLTGSLPTAARRSALLQAASGEAGIVVGTHALLSDNVTFADLGLVVVDEQHRFGVEQRDALRAKGVGDSIPHLLVMTATPIPRTVAMTVFGDLEISTLREIPKGRAGIESILVPASKPHWVDRIWHRVREEVDAGRRAYIVCSRIGDDEETAPEPDSEEREPVSVIDLAEQLRDHPAFAGLDREMLHGRLPGEEKDRVMERFVSGEAPVRS